MRYEAGEGAGFTAPAERDDQALLSTASYHYEDDGLALFESGAVVVGGFAASATNS
jgi:hypothetical protein